MNFGGRRNNAILATFCGLAYASDASHLPSPRGVEIELAQTVRGFHKLLLLQELLEQAMAEGVLRRVVDSGLVIYFLHRGMKIVKKKSAEKGVGTRPRHNDTQTGMRKGRTAKGEKKMESPQSLRVTNG